MIKVTLEIIPQGDVSRKYVAGHLIIANDGTGTPGNHVGIGNYDYEIHGPVMDEPGHALKDELWEKGRLEGFQRERGYWSCVKEVLNKAQTDYDKP